MKELFFKICFGLNKQSLSKKEQKTINELVELGLVSFKKDLIFFSQDLILARVDMPKTLKHIAFLVPINKTMQDIKISTKNLNAKNGDLVLLNKKNKIKYVLSLPKPPKICLVTHEKHKTLVTEFFTLMQINTTSKKKSLKTLPNNCVVSVGDDFEIKEILGVLDDARVDEQIVLKRYAKKESFSQEALQEANSYPTKIDASHYKNRLDLRDLDFVTIDPNDAKDYDDAIYYDSISKTLFVAIADVCEYVSEFSSIDKEAKKRGFSIYFAHKSVPMLPRELSENLCSLKPKEDRLAFVAKIRLDDNLQVIEQDIFEAIICSKKRFTYDDVDKILIKQKTKFDFLLDLAKLTKLLRQNRLKKGYTFESGEIKLELDKNLDLINATKAKDTTSHFLVEESMLLANICAASFFKEGLFRTHESIARLDLKDLLKNLHQIGIYAQETLDIHKQIELIQKTAKAANKSDVVDKMIVRTFKKAQYSYNNTGHFGLGFSSYTHFTSPIRRYSDLLVHRLIKSIKNSKPKLSKYIQNDMLSATKILSQLEEETNKIMWDYDDFIYTRWAAKHLGESFSGVVTYVGKEISVSLTNGAIGAKVICTSKMPVNILDVVNLRLDYAQLINTKIYAKITNVQKRI